MMNKKCSVLLILVLCSALLSEASSGGVRAASLASLCSNILGSEMASNLEYNSRGEQRSKRAETVFTPRLGKRVFHLDDYEEQGYENLPEELINSVQLSSLQHQLNDKSKKSLQGIVYDSDVWQSQRQKPQGRSVPPFSPRLGRTLNSLGQAQL